MAIGAVSSYGFSGAYWYGYGRTASQAQAVTPVTPVKAVNALSGSEAQSAIPVMSGASAAQNARPESVEDMMLRYDSDYAGMAVRQRIQMMGGEPAEQPSEALPGGEDVKSAAEAMEEGECQTCAERKYQDGSNDPGVSFKTPGHIAPEAAAAVVRGHEMEHVTREQAKAEREDRKVLQQSVTLHNSICPECGKVYVSGGTTRTTTAADNSEEAAQAWQQNMERSPFEAVA